MSLEHRDNFTKASLQDDTTSILFNDAYQLPKTSDNTKVKEGRLELTSTACDPYWDMVGASERLRRMAGVIDALHDITTGGEFRGGRPQELQQALRGLDGAGQQDIAMLQNLLRTSMNTQERGVTLNLTKDRDGHLHLNLSRRVNGLTYNLEVTGTSCIATSTSDNGKTSSVSPREAFNQILPLTAPHRQNDA